MRRSPQRRREQLIGVRHQRRRDLSVDYAARTSETTFWIFDSEILPADVLAAK